MNRAWTAIALLVALGQACPAEDQDPPEDRLPALLEKLQDDDYETREQATQDLSEFPKEYARRFLEMSQKAPLESRARLHQASKNVFLRKIIPETDEYKRLHAIMGFRFHFMCQHYEMIACQEGEEEDEELEEKMGLNMYSMVLSDIDPDSPAGAKLKEYDIVTQIDGQSPFAFTVDTVARQYGWFLLGKEYELTVRRYKDTEAIRKRQGKLDPNDEYEVLSIRITPARNPLDYDRRETLGNLEREKWQAFTDDVLRSLCQKGPEK